MPENILHRICSHLGGARDIYALGSASSSLKAAVDRYPWSRADYPADIPHLPPPKTSAGWYRAVRDYQARVPVLGPREHYGTSMDHAVRAAERELLGQAASHAVGRRPIAALSALPLRLEAFSPTELGVAVNALKIMGRVEEAVVLDERLRRSIGLMEAVTSGDVTTVRHILARGEWANLGTLLTIIGASSSHPGYPDVAEEPCVWPENGPCESGLAAYAEAAVEAGDPAALGPLRQLQQELPASVSAIVWRALSCPTLEQFCAFGEVIGKGAPAFEAFRASLGGARHRQRAVEYLQRALRSETIMLPPGMMQALSTPEILEDFERAEPDAVAHLCRGQTRPPAAGAGKTSFTLNIYLGMRSAAFAATAGGDDGRDVSRLLRRAFAAGHLTEGGEAAFAARIATFAAHGGAMDFAFVAHCLCHPPSMFFGEIFSSFGEMPARTRNAAVTIVEILAARGGLRRSPEQDAATLSALCAGPRRVPATVRRRLADALRSRS